MNEQLQQALASILDKTMKGVEAGVGLLQAELPDVIQQLLIWKASYAALETIAIALFIATYFWFCKRFRTMEVGTFWKDFNGSPEIGGGLAFITGGMLTTIFTVTIFVNIATILQILIAPKIYLIEYAASLAK